MTDVKIRLASHEDFRAIAQVHHDTWHATATGLPHWFRDDRPIAFFRGRWEVLLDDKERPCLVAEMNTGVVGFLRFGRPLENPESFPEYGELLTYYVLPEEQGKGIGTCLMQEAENALSDQGVRNALVYVSMDDAWRSYARDYYERRGYKEVKQQNVVYDGIPVVLATLSKSLA